MTTMVNDKVKAIERTLDNYYRQEKSQVNLEEALDSSGTDEESSVAKRKLRPRDASNFRTLMEREDKSRELRKYANRNHSPILSREKMVTISSGKHLNQSEFLLKHREKRTLL